MPPVFALPDITIPFKIETNASYMEIGRALSQQGCPVAYFSKSLTSAE